MPFLKEVTQGCEALYGQPELAAVISTAFPASTAHSTTGCVPPPKAGKVKAEWRKEEEENVVLLRYAAVTQGGFSGSLPR